MAPQSAPSGAAVAPQEVGLLGIVERTHRHGALARHDLAQFAGPEPAHAEVLFQERVDGEFDAVVVGAGQQKVAALGADTEAFRTESARGFPKHDERARRLLPGGPDGERGAGDLAQVGREFAGRGALGGRGGVRHHDGRGGAAVPRQHHGRAGRAGCARKAKSAGVP